MMGAVKSVNKRSNMKQRTRMQVKEENNRKMNLDRANQDIGDKPGGCGYSQPTGAEAKTAGWV